MKRFILFVLLALIGPAAAQPAFPPVGTQSSSFFNGTQAITRVITGVSGKQIYLTQFTVSALNTSAVTISRGTGTNCGTGTAVIFAKTFATGDLNFVTGDGAGVIAVVGSGVDVCITVATAVSTGWLSWAQF